jgi:hypothetical protein
VKATDFVHYTFPAFVDQDDGRGIMRAKAELVTELALVVAVNEERRTADVFVFASSSVVRGVSIDDGSAKVADREQVRDRIDAISSGKLDTAHDSVKGWVKERTP